MEFQQKAAVNYLGGGRNKKGVASALTMKEANQKQTHPLKPPYLAERTPPNNLLSGKAALQRRTKIAVRLVALEEGGEGFNSMSSNTEQDTKRELILQQKAMTSPDRAAKQCTSA